MIKFIVYGEPKGKGRPRAQNLGKYIHIYTDKQTATYENLVRLSYLEAKQESFLNGEQLQANIKIFQPIPKSTSKKNRLKMQDLSLRPTKKPDIDNVIKAIFDGLNTVAYKDDTQIIELVASKFYSESPRVEIEINKAQQEA